MISVIDRFAKARALLDQGSEVPLAIESLVQLLELLRCRSELSLTGIEASWADKTRGVIQVVVHSRYIKEFSLWI